MILQKKLDELRRLATKTEPWSQKDRFSSETVLELLDEIERLQTEIKRLHDQQDQLAEIGNID